MLAHREFRLLFLGRTVSVLGSAIAPIGLAFAVLDLTGSKADLGFVLAARSLPQVIFLLLGGVWADRLPRHRVMVGSSLVSGASQLAAGSLLLAGGARIWELAVLAAVNGTSSAFFFPANTGVVPQTVPEPVLQQANALLRLALNATNIVGASIGGVLVAVTSPGVAIAADGVTFALGAVFIGLMHLPEVPRRPAAASCASCARAGASSAAAPGCGRSSRNSRSSTRRRPARSACSGRRSRRRTSAAPPGGALPSRRSRSGSCSAGR